MATLPPLPPGAELVENPTQHLPPLPMGAQLVQEAQKRGMDIFPQWLQDAAKYGPGFLKETGKMALKGFGTTLANLGEGAGALAGEGMRGPNVTDSPKPQAEIAAALPDSFSNSPTDRMFRRLVEGSGGAMALPIPGAGLIPQLAAGAGSGLGGEIARQQAERFAPNSPMLQSGADILGSLFGGAATGFTLGPKQSVAQQDIRKALTGTTPAQYDKAAANSAEAIAAGSKTNTAAEAFPPGSGVMALADKARGASSDNALRLRTEARPGDLQGLADEFLNRISPNAVSPNEVGTSINKSADAISKSVVDARSAAMNAPMQGVFIDPSEVTTIAKTLNVSKQLAERQGLKDAYQAVIDNIMPGGKPIQRLSDLSLAITEAKPGMGNPNNLTGGAAQVSPNDLRQAVSHARDLLAQASPEFKKGLAAYESASENLVKPFATSSLDKLTSTNPYNPTEGRIGQIGQVFQGSSPAAVGRIAADLGQAPEAATSPLDIARALSQQKLLKGSTNPGNTIRGLQGSDAEAQLEALLQAGGNDAAKTLSPLNVADRLQPFAKPAGLNPPTQMEKLQLLIRPLRTIDMMTTGAGINKVNAEVAALLADGSPQAIRKLQEIGMFDPSVRKLLTAKAIIPAVGQEQ